MIWPWSKKKLNSTRSTMKPTAPTTPNAASSLTRMRHEPRRWSRREADIATECTTGCGAPVPAGPGAGDTQDIPSWIGHQPGTTQAGSAGDAHRAVHDLVETGRGAGQGRGLEIGQHAAEHETGGQRVPQLAPAQHRVALAGGRHQAHRGSGRL